MRMPVEAKVSTGFLNAGDKIEQTRQIGNWDKWCLASRLLCLGRPVSHPRKVTG